MMVLGSVKSPPDMMIDLLASAEDGRRGLDDMMNDADRYMIVMNK